MKIHSLTQGTPEWHAHRLTHFNASDAPAMMGCSPYETRTQLIHRMHTGIAPDVDAGTQARFDEGHRIEALARSWAEEHFFDGEFLYPIVGSQGEYSASFDGLLDDYSEDFEHKTLNDKLRKLQHFVGQELPLMYRVQMEQQLLICCGEKCLFMASKWNGDELVEERHCWYAPDLELRSKIVTGWQQFATDLAAYAPIAPTVQAVAAPVESLPAVRVQLDGQLVVASNLPEFAVALRAFIDRIPSKPSTDQEFADCEAACKSLKKAEDALESSETHALAQMTDVETMRRMVADLRNLARATRLASEKTVAARKESIRGEIVADGVKAMAEHIAALNTRLGKPYMPTVAADFGGAIKGKRTVDSLRDAVSTTLANAKISASATADKIQANLATLRELAKDHAFLFADTAQIVLKAPDDLDSLIKLRIAQHKFNEEKKETAQSDRIRAEEQEKAEKASRETKEAEDALVLSFEKEARRIEFDSVPYIEKASRTYESTAKDWEHDPHPRVAAAYAAGRAYLKDRLEAAWKSEKQAQDAIAAAQAVLVPAPVAAQPVPAAVTVRQVVQPIRAAATAVPTLTLGMVGTRLGFNLTADFLKNLGFDASKVKASCLYQEADFPLICMRLVSHIQNVQTKQAA